MQSIHVSRPELVEMFTSAAQGASVKSSLVRAAVSKQGTPSPFHTYGHTYIHTHTHTQRHLGFESCTDSKWTGSGPAWFGHIKGDNRAMPAGGLGTLMEVVDIEKLDDGRIIVQAIGLCKIEIGKQTSASPYPVSADYASCGHVRCLCPPRLNILPCNP